MPEPRLQIDVEFVDDARIEPHAGHQHKMAPRVSWPVERAQCDAGGNGGQKLRRRAVGPRAEPHFVGQNVGGARRQRAKGYVGTGHPVHGFVDGAVAARREDEVAALLYGLARQFARPVRARSRIQFDRVARFAEELDGVVQARVFRPLSPPAKGL